MNEASVESPCVCVCILDTDNICEGCFRSGDEIGQWFDASDEEKLRVLEKCRQRRRASGFFL